MSVEFDPVPLGRPRRRTDPVVVVVTAIVVGLAVAVLKPWEGGPEGPKAVVAGSGGAAASATVEAVQAPVVTATTGPATTEPDSIALGWSDVRRSASRNPTFAIDVVTVDWTLSTGSAGYPVFFEDWHLSTSDAETVLDTRGRSVVALGVATEPGSIAEDVRIWRKRANGDLEWVDANPIEDTVVGGPLVLAIPGEAIAFPAGNYRVDALVAGTIRRVDVAVPGPTGRIPPLTDTPYPTVGGLVSLDRSDPSDVLSGPFATVDGQGVALRALPDDDLDETRAWGASLAGLGGGLPYVARAYLPRATGIGVMLTSHAEILDASIARLAPDDRIAVAHQAGGVSSNHGGTPWIGFAAPDGRPWAPGVYAMSVAWRDADGDHARTWHVELRPGPSTPSAPVAG